MTVTREQRDTAICLTRPPPFTAPPKGPLNPPLRSGQMDKRHLVCILCSIIILCGGGGDVGLDASSMSDWRVDLRPYDR